MGARVRKAGPDRLRAPDHARWSYRRGVVQQRVRPPEPARLLPHFRAGSGGRGARLSQADRATAGGVATSRWRRNTTADLDFDCAARQRRDQRRRRRSSTAAGSSGMRVRSLSIHASARAGCRTHSPELVTRAGRGR
jgi:hypothetical protein